MAEDSFHEHLAAAKEKIGVQFDFKPKQVEALQSVYNGHDTMVVVPTGFGKSIIFQVDTTIIMFLFNTLSETRSIAV